MTPDHEQAEEREALMHLPKAGGESVPAPYVCRHGVEAGNYCLKCGREIIGWRYSRELGPIPLGVDPYEWIESDE